VFSEIEGAELFIDARFDQGASKLVVKADGLASGKGVTLCADRSEARAAVRRLLDARELGDAGERLVIEEFIEGREASIMALVDGERVLPLPPAEDHKAVGDGDVGPMTGGMGAISPTPVVDDLVYARAVRDVLQPTAAALIKEGRGFRGLLYAGLMITDRGPVVLEYNCRFGDPETQPILMRLDDDVAALLHQVAIGKVPDRLRVSKRAAACVVLTSAGYPGKYRRGDVISGLEEAGRVPDVMVFHAGTESFAGGEIRTNGGRVLGVTALGDNVQAATKRAYEAVAKIKFDGMHHRRDIGARRRS
jgi:phosphoribosylamine--glycine ligase